MERLRPLTEADCYARLYGRREPTVTIVSREARRQNWPSVTGEELRDAFGDRLDAREGLSPLDAEAA
jgi:hypothetical protein